MASSARLPLSSRGGGCDGRGVLSSISLEKQLLLVVPREEEEDQRRTEQDGDDPGRICRVGARKEGLLRRSRDLLRVLRELPRHRLRPCERLRELGLDTVGDQLLVR